MLVVIAASTGGLAAVRTILEVLPADFPAAIIIVQHRDPEPSRMFEELLARRTRLTVKQAERGDQLRAGWVYVAPPNKHLLVTPHGLLSLRRSEGEILSPIG
jgi:two-component system, chemotaxis family, protein-glutamate methylesterase/glutaminase